MFKKSIFRIKNDQFYYRGHPYLLAAGLPEGIPAFPAELIFQHKPIKKKIILIRGMYPQQAPDFDQQIMPIIKTVVRHMHLLPATESHHHSEGMGLLTHSLDSAYRALIRAKTETWDDDLENHWQVAAMLTGLLSDIGVPYESLWVQRSSDGQLWDCKEPLADWLSDSATQNYHLCWRVGRPVTHKKLTLSLPLAKAIISPELQSFLAPVWEAFCIALDVQGSKSRNKLQKILNQANLSSVICSIAASCDAALSRGSMPPAWFQYLFIIESLVRSDILTVNLPDSAVFITSELGVMLDLYKISQLSKEGGLPAQYSQQLRSSGQVRQAMADMDKLIPWQKPCGKLVDYWNINLQLEVDGEKVTVNRKVIRLSGVAQSMFSVDMPKPIKIEINE